MNPPPCAAGWRIRGAFGPPSGCPKPYRGLTAVRGLPRRSRSGRPLNGKATKQGTSVFSLCLNNPGPVLALVLSPAARCDEPRSGRPPDSRHARQVQACLLILTSVPSTILLTSGCLKACRARSTSRPLSSSKCCSSSRPAPCLLARRCGRRSIFCMCTPSPARWQTCRSGQYELKPECLHMEYMTMQGLSSE